MASATRSTSTSVSTSNGGGRFGKILLGLLLVVLVVGTSIGATVFILQKAGLPLNGNQAESPYESKQPAPLPPPIFAPLEPFTVTLRDDRTTRILYLAVTLRLTDEASRNMVNEYMPEVRDRVLRLLSIQNPNYVQTPEGREKLVHDLLYILQQPYQPQPRGPEISAVLFTAFVVQ